MELGADGRVDTTGEERPELVAPPQWSSALTAEWTDAPPATDTGSVQPQWSSALTAEWTDAPPATDTGSVQPQWSSALTAEWTLARLMTIDASVVPQWSSALTAEWTGKAVEHAGGVLEAAMELGADGRVDTPRTRASSP